MTLWHLCTSSCGAASVNVAVSRRYGPPLRQKEPKIKIKIMADRNVWTEEIHGYKNTVILQYVGSSSEMLPSFCQRKVTFVVFLWMWINVILLSLRIFTLVGGNTFITLLYILLQSVTRLGGSSTFCLIWQVKKCKYCKSAPLLIYSKVQLKIS